jgi:hypothetical protein
MAPAGPCIEACSQVGGAIGMCGNIRRWVLEGRDWVPGAVPLKDISCPQLPGHHVGHLCSTICFPPWCLTHHSQKQQNGHELRPLKLEPEWIISLLPWFSQVFCHSKTSMVYFGDFFLFSFINLAFIIYFEFINQYYYLST